MRIISVRNMDGNNEIGMSENFAVSGTQSTKRHLSIMRAQVISFSHILYGKHLQYEVVAVCY